MYTSATSYLRRILSSQKFFILLVVAFVVESLWYAVSSQYPMAADEDFHFGIIQIYSHQWGPFFAAQPAGADMYGAIVRDGSYLYHYLLSFPLRVLDGIGLSVNAQVITLRIANVCLAAIALLLYRRILSRTRLSSALSNLAILIFVLIPAAPFVAGQINYDNLYMLGTAASILLAMQLVQAIRKTHRIPLARTVWLLILCLLFSLVKFAFLAIFFGIVLYIGYVVFRQRRHLQPVFKYWKHDMARLSAVYRIVLVALFVLSAGLFVERYGYNALKYRSLTPECDTVLSIEQCQNYGPWVRNYKFKTLYFENRQRWNLVEFTSHWIMNYKDSLIYTLNGPFSNYTVGYPIPGLRLTTTLLAWASVIPILWSTWKLFKSDKALRMLVVVSLLYVAVLFIQNYADFKSTGQAVAQQGRYLLPVLVFILAWTAASWNTFINDLLPKSTRFKYVLAILVTLGLLQGGGILTFVMRSDHDWFWDSALVESVNDTTRTVVKPLMIGE